MRAPGGELAFDFGGQRWSLIYDMKAIAFFEREADASIVDVLSALEQSRESGRAPKLSHLALLMQSGLQRHHPDVDLDSAMAMAASPAVQQAMGVGLQAAMPDGDDGEAEGNELAASTGTRHSRPRSKRG